MASPRHLNITYQEPQVISDGASKDIEFLLDTGATYSVLTQPNGLLCQHSCTVTGIDGWPQVRQFTCSLACGIGCLLLSHSFLLIPECPTPLLGATYLLSHKLPSKEE